MKLFLSIIVGVLAPAIVFVAASRGVHIAEHGFQSSSFDIQQGRSIFASRCARCHSLTGTSATIGPNLSQIGSTAGQRKPGMTAAAYILESILKPTEFKAPGSSGEMPANLAHTYDDGAIRSLVAVLCSTGGGVEDGEIRSLVIDRPVVKTNDTAVLQREQVSRGEQLYRGKAKCATCHPFYGGSENELTAPYLFYRGYKDKEQLRRALVAPHASIAPRYQQTTVILTNGQTLTGKLLSQDVSRVVLLLSANGLTTPYGIPLADIEVDEEQKLAIILGTTSAMPSGIEQLLSPEELDDLLQFLLAAN